MLMIWWYVISHFDTIAERDVTDAGTDGRTDRIAINIARQHCSAELTALIALTRDWFWILLAYVLQLTFGENIFHCLVVQKSVKKSDISNGSSCFCWSGLVADTVSIGHTFEIIRFLLIRQRQKLHSAIFAVMRCPCVHLSLMFVDSVETNKHIFNFFSPSGSQTILVFRTKRHGNIPTGTPLTGALNAKYYT